MLKKVHMFQMYLSNISMSFTICVAVKHTDQISVYGVREASLKGPENINYQEIIQ